MLTGFVNNMAKTRDFSYLPRATVQTMLDNALAAIAAASNSQSYNIGNRHQQNAALNDAAQMVEDCQIALAQIDGIAAPVNLVNFRTGATTGYY